MSSADIRRSIDAVQKEKKRWRQRQEAVENVKTFFQKEIDDYVDDYNKKLGETERRFTYGYKGFSNSGYVEAELSKLKEPGMASGYSEVTAGLSREINYCGSKISQAEAKIRELQRALEEAIAEEQALAEQLLTGGAGISAGV